jgi:hemolysin III
MVPALGLREPISSATHFVAFLWAIYATLLLLRLCQGERTKQLSLGIFGASMIALYAASSAYHGVSLSVERLRLFQLIDHSAIYGLIAGTYTPAFLVLLHPGLRRRLLLGGIWTLALIGILGKWLLPETPYELTIGLYLGLGYSGLLPVLELKRAVGSRGLCWAISGGLFYTMGCLADLMQWPILYPGVFGQHEFFHLCSMAGTACHFNFMMLYVVPFTRRDEAAGALTGHRPVMAEDFAS